ncbi:ATP-binding protein [Paenibacillus sp. N3/727]|uniref:ATP-binding protein n=1 Tax=Paenibacillus sp. N3/727 TaxID=2925845 RepID=UPI001F53273B|nr:ATP-binding protein [Paenibacillus sp. N3/727]UNK20699.1 ATP-binding protein [Paenibacillus sp. N3/727]
MECVIFIGIQASGKSTFYKERFFKTHMRINLDMLRTRNREDVYLAASIEAKQPFVVDNTNPTIDDRKKYIEIARKNKFKVVGYYFEPDYELSYARNVQREGKEKVREIGLKSTLKKLQIPTYDEGFDELYFVNSADGKFEVEQWHELE